MRAVVLIGLILALEVAAFVLLRRTGIDEQAFAQMTMLALTVAVIGIATTVRSPPSASAAVTGVAFAFLAGAAAATFIAFTGVPDSAAVILTLATAGGCAWLLRSLQMACPRPAAVALPLCAAWTAAGLVLSASAVPATGWVGVAGLLGWSIGMLVHRPLGAVPALQRAVWPLVGAATAATSAMMGLVALAL